MTLESHTTHDWTTSLTIDTSGTRCPLPLLRAKQALKTLTYKQILEVITTDPAAKGDFQAMLKHLPHKLIHCVRQKGETGIDKDYFYIEKGDS